MFPPPRSSLPVALLLLGTAAGCGVEDTDPHHEDFDEAASMSSTDFALTGCDGKASSTLPFSGAYTLTTFGGPGESQPVACGGSTRHGTWYYAASSQRYGCGSRIRLTANGRCVVAQTADYGPDVCVERAAQGPVLDASPLVAQALFGTAQLGWSERRRVTVTRVSRTTPLGPCH